MKLTYLTGIILSAAIQVQAISEEKIDQLTDIIYVIEGGAKTRYPYGIMITTKNPRRVCKNTIRNNYKRWEKAGKPGLFIDWLADIYVHDEIGNRNWKKNIRFYLKGGLL